MPTADFWNRDYVTDRIDDDSESLELLPISKSSLVTQLITDIHSDVWLNFGTRDKTNNRHDVTRVLQLGYASTWHAFQ